MTENVVEFMAGKIKSIPKGRSVEVVIPYEAGMWLPVQPAPKITLTVVTEDGKYYNEGEFEMVKESGIWMYLHMIMDYFKNIGRVFGG